MAGGAPTLDFITTATIGSAYIYRVGGTDVSVADGGTGASTLASNSILTGNGTSAIQAEANLTFDGTTLTHAGGVSSLTHATANRIEWGTAGVAAPGASSAGMKLKLYGANGVMATTDYCLGIESNNLWINSGGTGIKWYIQGTIEMFMTSTTLDIAGLTSGLDMGTNVLTDTKLGYINSVCSAANTAIATTRCQVPAGAFGTPGDGDVYVESVGCSPYWYWYRDGGWHGVLADV